VAKQKKSEWKDVRVSVPKAWAQERYDDVVEKRGGSYKKHNKGDIKRKEKEQ
jgi:hypothetical protein